MLVERLGCTDGEFASAPGAGWHEADVWDCLDDEVSGRVYGSLGPAIEAEREYDQPYDGCSDLGVSPAGGYVVAGDTWVAVVLGQEDATPWLGCSTGSSSPARSTRRA